LAEQVFDGDVRGRVEEGVDDQPALLGRTEPFSLHVGGEQVAQMLDAGFRVHAHLAGLWARRFSVSAVSVLYRRPQRQ
jgi:hypothetical protein